jgi:hypothetical protein
MATSAAAAEYVGDDKAIADHKETLANELARDAAERGHLATDQFGHSLVEFDKKAESRLRLKIDFYIVPTVALMYLFCFIDRANIGKRSHHQPFFECSCTNCHFYFKVTRNLLDSTQTLA